MSRAGDRKAKLAAAGLVHRYAPLAPPAVDGVDLELRAGELLAVIGPNGAGKSTLLRLLAGLLRPQAGVVHLQGRALTEFGARERARSIALVPQALRALPDESVRGFVEGGRYAHVPRFRGPGPADRRAVEHALERLDLRALADRPLPELSGGQRQRVLLARALATEAEVLLVDEPTTALDLDHQLAVFEILGGLARDGRAVLVVTHDLNLASQFASRLLLLRDGRVLAAGIPEQVLSPPVLAAVYGSRLLFGTAPAPGGAGTRPFVLPWSAAEESLDSIGVGELLRPASPPHPASSDEVHDVPRTPPG